MTNQEFLDEAADIEDNHQDCKFTAADLRVCDLDSDFEELIDRFFATSPRFVDMDVLRERHGECRSCNKDFDDAINALFKEEENDEQPV